MGESGEGGTGSKGTTEWRGSAAGKYEIADEGRADRTVQSEMQTVNPIHFCLITDHEYFYRRSDSFEKGM